MRRRSVGVSFTDRNCVGPRLSVVLPGLDAKKYAVDRERMKELKKLIEQQPPASRSQIEVWEEERRRLEKETKIDWSRHKPNPQAMKDFDLSQGFRLVDEASGKLLFLYYPNFLHPTSLVSVCLGVVFGGYDGAERRLGLTSTR